jgi:hypothetical protein
VVIDELVPSWHRREVHRRRTGAPAADLMRAVDELRWQDVPVFAVLMRIRAGGRRLPGATIMAGMTAIGFAELARTADEVVYGGIGRPWSPRGGAVPLTGPGGPTRRFVGFAEPGWAKMALSLRAGDGEISTETRVWLTDRRARRAFAPYWFVIRPFSGAIRRAWLAAIARRAASGRG